MLISLQALRRIDTFLSKIPISSIAAAWVLTTVIRNVGIVESTNASRLQEIKPLDLLRRIEKPLAYMVGGVTIIWTLERTAVFWS